jgi:hypothetical protein
LTRAPRRGRAGAFASDASEHCASTAAGVVPEGDEDGDKREIEGEVAVWVRMDQHFPRLDHWDNAFLVKCSDVADEAGALGQRFSLNASVFACATCQRGSRCSTASKLADRAAAISPPISGVWCVVVFAAPLVIPRYRY